MAVTYDKQLAIAEVYAQALFELAHEDGRIDEVRSELEELVRLGEADTDPAVRGFFTSQALDDDTRAALLEKCFRGKLSDLTLNALLVMNDHGRQDLLPALLECFNQRQEEAAGQVGVTATTAVALDDSQRHQVVEVAAKLSGRTPLVDFRVDPQILGGLIVQIGDLRYDNSVATHLAGARSKLRERSEHGLGSGLIE